MNLKKLINKGRQKLSISKPIELRKTKALIELPKTRTMAKATTQTTGEKHIITVDTSIQDFLLPYKVNHELCHLKLNEMGIKRVDEKLKQIKYEGHEDENRSLTLAVIVYEYYAEWMCHQTFGIPYELVDAYAKVFSNPEMVRTNLEKDLFGFFLESTCFLLYRRLGYDMNTDSFFCIIDRWRPGLTEWMHTLRNFLDNLPPLPETLSGETIDDIVRMILKIYTMNPLFIS